MSLRGLMELLWLLPLILINCAVFGVLFYFFRLPRAFDTKSRFAAACLAGTAFVYAEFYVDSMRKVNVTVSNFLFNVGFTALFFPPFFFLGLFALVYFCAAFRGRKLVSDRTIYILFILTLMGELAFLWYASGQSW